MSPLGGTMYETPGLKPDDSNELHLLERKD